MIAKRCTPPRDSRRGFSLLMGLLLLMLLLLVAMGLATLSSRTTKRNRDDSAERVARTNARLALMVALGELQVQLGPDQRVSAPLGILDENPATLAIDGVAQPHWTGVWSTAWPAGDSAWLRDDEEGGLRDRRTMDGYDRKRELRSILISGNEGGMHTEDLIRELEAGLGPDAVQVVGPGSVAHSSQEVEVPRVPLRDGAYAYWVGDLGVKARVNLVDPYAGQALTDKLNPDGMERIVNAQDVEEGLIFGFRKLRPGEAPRAVTDRTLELTSQNSRESVKTAYHDLTTWSRAVLANTRDGGLQRDLTAYLNGTGDPIPDLVVGDAVVSKGLQDLDNMIGPANSTRSAEEGINWNRTGFREISPRFAMLRKWAQAARDLPYAEAATEAVPPEPLPPTHPVVLAMRNNLTVYDGSNNAPASFLPLATPNLAPVMVEGSIYYNLATYAINPASPSSRFRIRMAIYPRIALWNPYNVAMKLDTTVAELFVNGNKRIKLRSASGIPREIDIPFGRGAPNGNGRHPAHYRGTLFFTIPPVTLGAGETLVFAPDHAAAYEHDDVFRNTLTADQAPSPDLYYWQDMVDELDFAPVRFLEYPEPGTGSGSDNYLMALKDAGLLTRAVGQPTDDNFNDLPQIIYANPSLQAGGADELPVNWNSNREVDVPRLANPGETIPATVVPDVRTRDGFRLRWWNEHISNLRGSGQLAAHPRHFQTAAIANWNPRAAYYCRTPFDNVSDRPPNFFGLYTRDLFDGEVSWEAMRPRSGNRGNPFGPPREGVDHLVLFDVPRAELGIPSLGYLRHLKLSEFGWAPSYAVGSSLVDPRVGRVGTIPLPASFRERTYHGWNEYRFGWDPASAGGPTYWSLLFRQILFDKAETNQVVHDLSFELNHNLWDDYFLSTGDALRKRTFLKSMGRTALPNGRFGVSDWSANDPEGTLNDFHRAASILMLEGGFNVHSISKEAWKAVLASTRDTSYGDGGVPFPRVLNPPEGEWLNGAADSPEAMAGFRSLSLAEIDALAEELVREVKERAPFFGLGDFINRRLVDSPHGDRGPLEAAIAAAGLNQKFRSSFPLDNSQALPRVTFANMADATQLDQTLKPDSVAWGIPGYLTQGDLVQVIGSSLRPRSDTFVVRAYGESPSANGKGRARAWCEAIVQRTPIPVTPDQTGLNPKAGGLTLGRRFEIVSFRWLSKDEI